MLAGVEKTQEADYIALTGGQLGRPNSTRRRTYEAIKRHLDSLWSHNSDYSREELMQAHDEIYRYPLLESARDKLNNQLRLGITDESLAAMVIGFWRYEELSRKSEGEDEEREPRILCSLGLFDLSGE